MKSFRKINVKIMASFAFFIILSWKTVVFGQAMPQINARFTNPQFDHETRNYFLDVELNARESREVLFGMNVRFFYDATLLEYQYLDQFKQGYGVLGDLPKVFKGNDQSGVQMFNLRGAAAYVNGAIQLLDEQTPLEILPAKWVKVFRVCFKVPVIFQDAESFCPSVFWDLKPGVGAGGFLTGSDGLIITVAENNRSTRKESLPSISQGTYFNWELNPEGGMPYGYPVTEECLNISQTVATEDPDLIDLKGYALFQNKPNPFAQKTIIEFILPKAQEVSLRFYDASGNSLEEIKGYYKAGKNVVNVERKPWMSNTKVIFYRIETEGYTSKMRKMTLVTNA